MFRQGYRVGEKSGDYLYLTLNYFAAHILTYFSGDNLSTVRKELRGSMLKMQGKDNKQFVGQPNASQIHAQCVALQDGEERLNEESLDGILGLAAVVGSGKLDATVEMFEKILVMSCSDRFIFADLIEFHSLREVFWKTYKKRIMSFDLCCCYVYLSKD